MAAATRDYFDTYGNLTWHMAERGFLIRTSFACRLQEKENTSCENGIKLAGKSLKKPGCEFGVG